MCPVDYTPGSVLRKPADWKNLRFYQKTDALYQLTVIFCRRFLPKYGDRTVDQMIQAARSGKQNIIEGSEDGKTSTEMELKLINVARSSVSELREDYRDYLNKKSLTIWQDSHPRYYAMQTFCKNNNKPSDFLTFSEKWNEEEFCNICLTLCYQVDAMMNSYLKHLEELFVTKGGIKERMHHSRTDYRAGMEERVKELEAEVNDLKAKLKALESLLPKKE